GHRARGRIVDPRRPSYRLELATRQLSDLGDVVCEPFGAERIVDPRLGPKVRGGTADLASPLPETSKHLGQVLGTHDDQRHEDNHDKLRETEAEHSNSTVAPTGVVGAIGVVGLPSGCYGRLVYGDPVDSALPLQGL